jgi:putative redox protein
VALWQGGQHGERKFRASVSPARAHREQQAFEVHVDAEKVRDDAGNHLADIVVTFRVRFPDGEGGDKARALLPDAVRKSHDRLCTVSRTVELGTPVETRIV